MEPPRGLRRVQEPAARAAADGPDGAKANAAMAAG